MIKLSIFDKILDTSCNFEDFVKVLRWNPQVIVHTAWITTPGIYRNHPSNKDYADFTINLANYIRHSEIEHLIVLGTCAEYGRQIGPSTAGITELSPTNLYSEKKIAAFRSVEKILQNSTTRFTWARLFYPYGPYQHEKRLIPHLVQSLKTGNPIHLADISSIYDWITSRDVAGAILWIIEHKLPIEIDIGTSVGTTNLELLLSLEELLPGISHERVNRKHEIGISEVFVMGKSSPLYTSGWLPNDTLNSGLEWVLKG